jgi:hypothetical protein
MIYTGKKTLITASAIAGFVILFTTMAFGVNGFRNDKSENSSPRDSLCKISSIRLPDSVTFAGEVMPLNNIDTRESLEREILISTFRHSSTILIIKKSNRYFPLIGKILKEYNIPDDFKYLVAAESEYSNVISPAGATGFWQIMPETGKEEGMEVNKIVDERYDVEKSTRFACRFFRKSYEKYGNWTLAAASYNCGRGGIDEQIGIQKQNNYYDLLLNEETARYIFRAVAYKIVISDPVRYGFNLEKEDLYSEYKYSEVKVDSSISDFSAFAEKYGTNYKMIKLLNPWLRKPFLNAVPGKEYAIKIPAEGMRNVEKAERIN